MAFGQRQIVHVCIEIAVASGTSVLRIRNDQVTGTPGKGIAQVVQGPFDRTQTIRTLLAQRTWPSLIVAAAPHKSCSGQILNTCNPLCFICHIFAWSKHLDTLQHRVPFPRWNIGTWTPDTSRKLCIAATVSLIALFFLQSPPFRLFCKWPSQNNLQPKYRRFFHVSHSNVSVL